MEPKVRSKFQSLKEEFSIIEQQLQDTEIISNSKLYSELAKKEKLLLPKIDLFNKYLFLEKEISEILILLNTETDKDFLVDLKSNLSKNQNELILIENKMINSLIEVNEIDSRDVIFEISGAVGGDEAKLFAADLFWMYQKYATKNGFKVNIIESQHSNMGGFDFIVFEILGEGAYGKFKFESGVHRVQRIPTTEANGRVHTSTSTILVLPKVEEVDIEVNNADLKIDTYRSGGAGGQHVNKTESAVRITHIPTGLVVASQEGKSQHANRERAMNLLRSKLFDFQQIEKQNLENKERKSKVGTGDRSEKIRTYNFPDNRVTDHRVLVTLKKLDRILDGTALGELLDLVSSLMNEKEN